MIRSIQNTKQGFKVTFKDGSIKTISKPVENCADGCMARGMAKTKEGAEKLALVWAGADL